MNFGGDMSMHTMAVHAPGKHLRQVSGSGSATDSMRKGRRQRTATNGSDSSSATQSSRATDYVEGMYDYRPVFHFNLSAMLHTLTESVGDVNDLRSPQPPLTPSPSMKPITSPSMSFHSGRKVRLSDSQRTKGHEAAGLKRDKKFADMIRVDLALRM